MNSFKQKFPAPMRETRNLLILLGLICQGYSFGNYLVPVIYALTWFFCLQMRRNQRFLPRGGEEVITFSAIVATYLLGGDYGYNQFVFIGNALVIYQCLHLIRPLNIREKMYSVAVALVHLAVGAQLVVDYEFVLVLAAALYLIPNAFFEIAVERIGASAGMRHFHGRREYLYLTVIMVLFFLLFPRFRIFTAANPIGGLRGQQDEMDMSDSADEGSSLLLFRVEGDDITYLKRTALDHWNGQRWSQSQSINQLKRFPFGAVPEDAKHRTVRIEKARMLGNSLPSDGHVVDLKGSFMQQPIVAEHGGIMVTHYPSHLTAYEYWTVPDNPRRELNPRQRRQYLQVPSESPTVRNWLQQQTSSSTDPEQVAASLVAYFHANYTYQLGAPDLDRTAPVQDFLFNQQEGHCERFASALTILLRMSGIPARVALGWIATERNDLGGFYNIRARHGHAWTEAWIDGRGWVTLDATPYGSDFTNEVRSLGLTLYEWVQHIWYAKIVQFDVSEQTALFHFVGTNIRVGIAAVMQNLLLVIAALVMGAAGWTLRKVAVSGFFGAGTDGKRKERQKREASHFYGRMLTILTRQGYGRRAAQTPHEYLNMLEERQYPQVDNVKLLTEQFCVVHYGGRSITASQRTRMHEILQQLARQ